MQVRTACTADHPTPKKRKGRNSTLTEGQAQELIIFVCSSRTNRLMSYIQLSKGPFVHWQVGEYTIRNTLRRHGFH